MAQLSIEVIAPSGATYENTTVPGTQPVQDVARRLASQAGLRQAAKDGSPIQYELHAANPDRPLEQIKDLESQGIVDGASLRIVAVNGNSRVVDPKDLDGGGGKGEDAWEDDGPDPFDPKAKEVTLRISIANLSNEIVTEVFPTDTKVSKVIELLHKKHPLQLRQGESLLANNKLYVVGVRRMDLAPDKTLLDHRIRNRERLELIHIDAAGGTLSPGEAFVREIEESAKAKRMRRLQNEYQEMLNFQAQSRFIDIQVLNQSAGAPTRFLLTFTVRGISGIQQGPVPNPIYSDFHQVEMEITPEYPKAQPSLLWKTPIWHPNIAHKEPRHVCTDEANSFHQSKKLYLLVEYLAMMAQYKIYHARLDGPLPWDTEVASWVREFAEKSGLIGPDKPVDDRHLSRMDDVDLGRRGKTTPRLYRYEDEVRLGKLASPKRSGDGEVHLGIRKN